MEVVHLDDDAPAVAASNPTKKRKANAGSGPDDAVVVDLLGEAPGPTPGGDAVLLDLTGAAGVSDAVQVIGESSPSGGTRSKAARRAAPSSPRSASKNAASGGAGGGETVDGADASAYLALAGPARRFADAVSSFINAGKDAKSKSATTTTQKAGQWASGTGYGGDRNSAKTLSKAVAAAQKNEAKHDADMTREANALAAAVGTARGPGASCQVLLQNAAVGLRELMRDSFLDVAKRGALYEALARLCSQIAKHANLVALFVERLPTWTAAQKAAAGAAGAGGSKDDLADSLLAVLKAMHQQATNFQKLTSANTSSSPRSRSHKAPPPPPPAPTSAGAKKSKKEMAAAVAKQMTVEQEESDEREALRLANALIKAYDDVVKACEANGTAIGEDKARAGQRNRYCKALQPLQFDSCELLARHYYRSEAMAARNHSLQNLKSRNQRVAREISSLSNSLPIEWESSILARVDNDKPDVLKVLIFPAPDTPYALGAFEFDVFLPPEFPTKPPKVQFLTTGGNTVRFNPNLYESGKVCLSLLGTWEGPGWDEKNSTLLQVLVSIQSLIFVDKPYFNEPGWERAQGTPEGERAAAAYNARVRLNTLKHAVLPHLRAYASGRTGASTHDAAPQGSKGKKPSSATGAPSVFSEAIRVHFQRKQRELLEISQKWLDEECVRKETAKDSLYCDVGYGPPSAHARQALTDAFHKAVQEVKDTLWKMDQ